MAADRVLVSRFTSAVRCSWASEAVAINVPRRSISVVSRIFCIVGPTATGKSQLAADVAVRLQAEIVNADAFQIYGAFDVLSGKPDPVTLGAVPHHLIGVVPASEEMNAAKYRELALTAIAEINGRGKLAVVVGGSGLYVKSLTHGLLELPSSDAELRAQLDNLSTEELRARLSRLDSATAEQIDSKNRRRLIRALEICLGTGKPASAQRTQWKTLTTSVERSASGRCHGDGVFVFHDRDELYQRINHRVEAMLKGGAIEEVRRAGELSRTLQQMIGISDIRKYLAGEISLAQCSTRIQQFTRRYAKRQLTWFRQQTNLLPLNLSLLSHNEAVEWVTRRALAHVR